jgi:hypothetical protein
VVRGPPVSPWDGLSPEEDLPHLDECLAMIAERVLVYGHSLFPFCAQVSMLPDPIYEEAGDNFDWQAIT